MTMAKAIIKSLPNGTGIDVRVGWDVGDEGVTDEEKRLAVCLAMVMNEYIKLLGKKGGAE